MNYYGARQKLDENGKPSGLFHYTCRNDEQIWPVGYCGAFKRCDKCDGQMRKMPYAPGPYTCETCRDTGTMKVPEAERCPGHATAGEANEHYRQYLLDSAVFQGPKTTEWPKEKCEADGCNEEATHLASIPGHMEHTHKFCAKHCTCEELAKKVKVGESISSY